MWIVSSFSLSIIASPSSDEELPDSYSIMLELPTELDNPDLSAFGICDHIELFGLLGDSGMFKLLGGLKRPFLGNMPPRDPTTGEDSGDDSAKVE